MTNILITGFKKTGTTLMANALTTTEKYTVLSEFSFQALYNTLQYGIKRTSEIIENHYFVDTLPSKKTIFVTGILKTLGSMFKREVVVKDTQLFRMLDDEIVIPTIVCIRNPITTLLSWYEMQKRIYGRYLTIDEIYSFAEDFVFCYRTLKESLKNAIFVKFENFATKYNFLPVERFLGLSRNSIKTEKLKFELFENGKFYCKEETNPYKIMSRTTLRDFVEVTQPIVQEFGYDLASYIT